MYDRAKFYLRFFGRKYFLVDSGSLEAIFFLPFLCLKRNREERVQKLKF